MSFDIYVHLPARSWPTARQLDEALVAAGYPVRLGARTDTAWDAPLAPVAAESPSGSLSGMRIKPGSSASRSER